MTKRQLFARVVERAAAHNMLVLLDMHRLDDQVIPDKWINEDYNLEDVYRGWDTILGDLKGQWNGACARACACVCGDVIDRLVYPFSISPSSDRSLLSYPNC